MTQEYINGYISALNNLTFLLKQEKEDILLGLSNSNEISIDNHLNIIENIKKEYSRFIQKINN